MIRENYNIAKADIKAGCTYYGSRYELRVWFDGMDLKEMGCIEYLPMYHLKDMGICKRGYSFKKAQEFLDSDKGKEWLSKHFKDRDYEHEKDELETKIRSKLWKMDLYTMIKVDKLLEGLIKEV
jgi:hypothetical protein